MALLRVKLRPARPAGLQLVDALARRVERARVVRKREADMVGWCCCGWFAVRRFN